MTKQKIILTDCDGVLVNWNAGFIKYMAELGHVESPDGDQYYRIEDRYGVTSDVALKCITDYNHSPFIATLPAYMDSVKYVKALAEEGFRFVVITSLSSLPDARVYRMENLKNLFGDIFLEVICIGLGEPKDSVLKSWENSGLFWIEDHIENSEAGHKLGLKSILVQHGHNSKYDTDHFPIVGPGCPWETIYNLVQNEYGI
jgi:FMN phosphatase YigB (HAD superfamily)